MRAKTVDTVLFVAAGTSSLWLLHRIPAALGYASAAVPMIGFFVAAGAVFFWRRVAAGLGLLSGVFSLYWFSRIEFAYFPALNSWIAFNLDPTNPYLAPDIRLAKAKVIFAVVTFTATACSIARLLPARWCFRGKRLRDITWPPVAVALGTVAVWFLASVSPYRFPLILDSVPPELVVLHVEKRGLQFHEVSVTTYRDGKFYIAQNDRRLFQYRFSTIQKSGVLRLDFLARVQELVKSLRFESGSSALKLRARNAEGWYVRVGRTKVLAFTTENGTKPPDDVTDLSKREQQIPVNEEQAQTTADVCMGFCYDPLAGLGFVAMNHRCREENGKRCR